VYIDDVIDAWVGALNNPASYGANFNLGSGRETSINALADHVLAAFDLGPADHYIDYAPGRPGEQRRACADVTRARAILRWEPRTPFASGLKETVHWARRSIEQAHPVGL
jgi:UDP-glucose 4-epimerase